jgi:hypothetical protein
MFKDAKEDNEGDFWLEISFLGVKLKDRVERGRFF